MVPESTLRVLISEFDAIRADFLGLLPEFDRCQFSSHEGMGDEPLYKASGILAFLAVAVARLALVCGFGGTPVIETREFKFVADPKPSDSRKGLR
jgi:hypothetical protein